MDANQIFAAAASGTVALGGATAFVKWVLPRWRQRRSDRAQLRVYLHGKPVIRDEQNNIIDPGIPALSKQLGDLREATDTIRAQLTPNSGKSIADQVKRIDTTVAELRTDQQVIKGRVDEARTLAGEAATIADRVAQKHDDGLARLERKIETVDEKVDELKHDTSERLVETEMKYEAWQSIAHELDRLTAPALPEEAFGEPDGGEGQ